MYLCYIDESGTPEIPGNTSHFILAGLAMPIWHWRDADREVTRVLTHYDLADAEFHTAWILKGYREQNQIQGFDGLSRALRRREVERRRNAKLLDLQRQQRHATYKQTKKDFIHTNAYVHLTRTERLSLVREVADVISHWGFARLFAESIDKIHFDPASSVRSVEEQAFEQVISRFQRFLTNVETEEGPRNYGLIVHDANQSVAKKHTKMMRHFHQQGTLWARITRIAETPLFVDSDLTRMVQMADLCAYAIRRYNENNENDLFNRIFRRADRAGQATVGVRHFSPLNCGCVICTGHSI
jgi:hypothetical protein